MGEEAVEMGGWSRSRVSSYGMLSLCVDILLSSTWTISRMKKPRS